MYCVNGNENEKQKKKKKLKACERQLENCRQKKLILYEMFQIKFEE